MFIIYPFLLKAECTSINIHKERQWCNFVYSMHNVHININSYLQHLFNAQYLAYAEQCFYIGFALNMAINMTISSIYSNK